MPKGGNTIFGAYPLDVDVNYANNRGKVNDWTWYYISVAQLSAYLQDEWAVSSSFRLTYGVRADKPNYFNSSYRSPNINANGTPAGSYIEGDPTVPNNDNLVLFDEHGKPVTNGVGKELDNTRFPTKKILLSPRMGFNWDVMKNKTLQLRGGSGLFTGRFPFVWIGNHVGNPFSFFYNVTGKNFKWQQVWRNNLGADFRTAFGTVFTVDAAYTKDVNAMTVRNYKLGTPTGTLNSGTGDQRKIYLVTNQGANNAYVFTNTDVGYQFNLSLQAQQNFKNGFFAMAAYNYLISKDASSISAEISSDAFDRNPILNNANEARLSTSLYGNTHRFFVAGFKKFVYGSKKNLATTVSVFSSWTSGNRFAYVYGGDINNDGTASNDLLYVPTGAEIDKMNFSPFQDVTGTIKSAAEQKAGFKNFISQDEYLKGKQGGYTGKYAGENPWIGQLDLRILQDLKLGQSGRIIQLSIDFVNLGNLIKSSWGVRKYATTSGYFQPLSVNYNNNLPAYTFDPVTTSTFTTSPDLISRWQMQVGLRFNF